MFREYDLVRLREDISERLRAGAVGTVLLVYDRPPSPRAYEVEFIDAQGDSIGTVTVDECVLAPAEATGQGA